MRPVLRPRSASLALAILVAAASGTACREDAGVPEGHDATAAPFALVLGIAQDGGYPQAGCRKACCRRAWLVPSRRRHVASLGLVDAESGERWVVDATPDLREQLHLLDAAAPRGAPPGLAGVLLTHAHIGHYAGLVHLGREVMGAREVPVAAMPRLRTFLAGSGPWDQLLRLGNIALVPLEDGVPVRLGPRLTVTPLAVPHRDEYSETVAFRVEGPRRSILWLPDIDKWERWATPLDEALAGVNVAFLDGTFFDAAELPGRDMSEIPHPFIVETLERLRPLPPGERAKVRFIHLNHSNPALDPTSEARRLIEATGARVARQGERLPL